MAAKITCRSRAKDLLEEIDLPRVILEAHPVGGDRIVLGLLRLPRFDIGALRRRANFRSNIRQLLPFFAFIFQIWCALSRGEPADTWVRACFIVCLLLVTIICSLLIELSQSRNFGLAEEQRRLVRYVGWAQEAGMAIVTAGMIWWILCLPFDIDSSIGGSSGSPT
ncbi:uncharacterized protein LOC116215876 [Punica granatum]|uniref:Uncharacterized protein LOC116215876 n=2 Tax=Punica granatum TaxID=22663 RepID=A0A6P8EML0_PUNGR|nr:uncharacterized protein LOC116215876 [Punica granatum]PKI50187.1 hypothetical protein CRG98_029431 [Punica granatum]